MGKLLVMISPHNFYNHVNRKKINRPLKFAEFFNKNKAISQVMVVNRLNPILFIKGLKDDRRLIIKKNILFKLYQDKDGISYLEHFLPFGFLERSLLPWYIKKVVKERSKDMILWIGDPKSVEIAEHINVPSIFDAYDDWSISPLFLNRKRHIKHITKGYQTATEMVDIITVNSKYMRDKFRDSNNVHIISNTSSINDESKEEKSKFEIDSSYKYFVGYVGNIHERINLEIVHYLIFNMPDTLFVFIGKNDFESSAFVDLVTNNTNIIHIPEVPFSKVPSYINKFDACIVPHYLDDYTLSQDSMKIYDYLAMGKPIVTTSIPPAPDLSEYLYVANTKEKFKEQLEIAYAEDEEVNRHKRINFVSENSWAEKIKSIVKLF
ncbi:glycosyltransferase [Terribacillus sp. JSM ZJ617]|uniref:glycosyltransferase n=1 Tax=Terribacillus sp. JSM ZJ617 TaxID=3342119 RepID=UPI0035A91077